MTYVGSTPIVVNGRPVYVRFTSGGAVEVHYERGRDSDVVLVPPYGEVEETYKYLCSLEQDRFMLAPTPVVVGTQVISSVFRVDVPTIYHVYWRQK